MLEILPIAISGFALLAAVLALPGFGLARWAMVIAALGAGQIYLAVMALGLMLLVENKWHFDLAGSRPALLFTGFLLIAVFILTSLSPVTLRTYSEGAQLLIYTVLFVLLLSYLNSGHRITTLLRACVVGSGLVAGLAYMTVIFGWQSPPFIFVGRGSNEGSVFLALVGVVPAAILFVRTRNPAYLLFAVVLSGIQLTATSRGSLAVSGLALAASVYYVSNWMVVRASMLAVAGYILVTNTDYMLSAYEDQLNFSALERIVLIEHGWALFKERFWTGWGWGSTSELATTAPTINSNYPHFHNAYVQLAAELGIFGLLLIAGFVVYCLRGLASVSFSRRNPPAQALIVISALAILIASIFDAMLFGADRALQIVILLALIVRTVNLVSVGSNSGVGLVTRTSPGGGTSAAVLARTSRTWTA